MLLLTHSLRCGLRISSPAARASSLLPNKGDLPDNLRFLPALFLQVGMPIQGLRAFPRDLAGAANHIVASGGSVISVE